MGFATWYTIVKIWDQNPTFSGALSMVSYWILTAWRQVDAVIYICFWSAFFYSRTKSGSLCLRKRLDQDADTPAGSNSIWTGPPPRLFVVGIYFLFGVNMGTFSVWTPFYLYMGVADRFMAVPYVVDCVLFWLVIKCFNSGRNNKIEEEEEEEEDKYSLLL
jgi:hypothetical protein